jgi:hypothetical protein
MINASTLSAVAHPTLSELVLSDRLIALAEDADHAGYKDTAQQLVTLACRVFDEAPERTHRTRPPWPVAG